MHKLSSDRSTGMVIGFFHFVSVVVIVTLSMAAPAFGQPANTGSSNAGSTSGPEAATRMHGSSSASGDAYNEMMQPMHTMHQAMSSVQSTGNPDKDFIILMVPHHEAAVDMAKAYLKHGQNNKLRKMAQSIVDSQETEIREMQDELRKLGGATSPGGKSQATTHTATNHH